MKSDSDYIFGGYCKIGFKINKNIDKKIDNNSFLFSYNFLKIYPVLKDEKVICHIGPAFGLCFAGSLTFENNFLKMNNCRLCGGDNYRFQGLSKEINGGKDYFKCLDLEVFQLL